MTPRRFLAALAMLMLITGSVTFSALPVTLADYSCGTAASPSPVDDELADACAEALAARQATALHLAAVGGASMLGATAVNPDRVRRPMDPPAPDY
jgi:hypothetical protein